MRVAFFSWLRHRRRSPCSLVCLLDTSEFILSLYVAVFRGVWSKACHIQPHRRTERTRTHFDEDEVLRSECVFVPTIAR